jgi:hypothetical protein
MFSCANRPGMAIAATGTDCGGPYRSSSLGQVRRSSTPMWDQTVLSAPVCPSGRATKRTRRNAPNSQNQTPDTIGAINVEQQRDSRSLSGPRAQRSSGAPRCMLTLRSRDCLTAARHMSSRSIRSSWSSASRERWSISTLDKLRLQNLTLGMAAATARAPQRRRHLLPF